MERGLVKINWGYELDPPLIVLNRHDLDKFGFEALKRRTDEFGWRGFMVVHTWGENPVALYRRW